MSDAAAVSSTPSFSDFDPSIIPYQDQAIDDAFHGYDYGLGFHEALYSGALGSSKTLTLAHIGIRHCLQWPGARCLIGRKALPDLKRTLYLKMREHLQGALVKERDYWETQSIASIRFRNGSEIIATSWADRDYMKVRSLDLSMALIEELTENDDEDRRAYQEIGNRIGRLGHVKQNLLACATNPDDPSHWAYEHFELIKDEGQDCGLTPLGLGPRQDRSQTKHVYYSVTADNPFLPPEYHERMRRDMDPREYQRMGLGRWIELKSRGIYHQYDRAAQFRDVDYQVVSGLPLILSWDFNIAEGKPLSVVVMQMVGDVLHVCGEAVVEGMRTEDSVEELSGRGWLDHGAPIVVSGDASGRHKDTRNNRSDYDIILKRLGNHVDKHGRRLHVTMDVPLSNPAVRLRHNSVNAYCLNDLGHRRLFVYRGAPTADKGLRLTRLKDRGQYVEDDSKAHPYQHITTAIGYGLLAALTRREVKPQRTASL